MHLPTTLTLLTGVATALSTGPPGPANNEIQITSVVFGGSGCPVGSVSGQLLPDPPGITLTYANLTAQTGRNITAASSRKNCQINIKMKHPPGWQFSVHKTNYTGYARIPIGTTGTVRAIYYFSGQTGQAISTMDVKGPYDSDFVKTDQFDIPSTTWSPCGVEGLLNINSEVRLTPTNSTETAVLSVTSLDKVELRWQRCGQGPPATPTQTPESP